MHAFDSVSTPSAAAPVPTFAGRLDRLIDTLPRLLVPVFTLFFFGFAILYALTALIEFVRPIVEEGDFVKGLFKGLHTGVVALAIYELAEIVHQEYHPQGRPAGVMNRIRRGIARFGSVVFVALVLESLIMVIKYSQQDLAGFLYYPAALIVSAALLLVALGVFARLTTDAESAGV
jgi:hypothetical protein